MNIPSMNACAESDERLTGPIHCIRRPTSMLWSPDCHAVCEVTSGVSSDTIRHLTSFCPVRDTDSLKRSLVSLRLNRRNGSQNSFSGPIGQLVPGLHRWFRAGPTGIMPADSQSIVGRNMSGLRRILFCWKSASAHRNAADFHNRPICG